jgi:hypothetical protein
MSVPLSSSSSSSSSSPRGFQAAREREREEKQQQQQFEFLQRNDAGRYLSSLASAWTDEKWMDILSVILRCLFALFAVVVALFALAAFERMKKREGEEAEEEEEEKRTALAVNEEEEEEEEENEEEQKVMTTTQTTETTTLENIKNMSEEELRVLELSVKMRDVLSKEKSNALSEARLSVERKQLEAKLAGLDLKKESNETMKTSNDMKRESLEFKMKLSREKAFREDVADALRTGLIVVCGALVYFGWNVIRDAWLNESEICFSSSSSSSAFSSFWFKPSNVGVFFSTLTTRLEKLWCVSKTFAKAAFTSVASLYCSKVVVKFGLLSGTNSTVSPLSSIALTLGVGGGYLGHKFVRYLHGDETAFLYLWSAYVFVVFLANESAERVGREVLKSTLRRILFRVALGFAVPLVVASVPFSR